VKRVTLWRLVSAAMAIALLVIVAALAWAVFALWRDTGGIDVDPRALWRQWVPQPTPTIIPSSVTIVRAVQRLSRLETVSYHMEKVITAETGQGPLGFLFGDKLLLIAYGEVIGGVDLGSLGPDDVYWAGDGTVFVRLPEVEVFVATLDNARTRVYDRRTGLVGLNPELESEARREAERLILEAALAEGLKEEGRANAEDFLRAFLEGLGASRVVFTDTLPLVQPTPSAVSE